MLFTNLHKYGNIEMYLKTQQILGGNSMETVKFEVTRERMDQKLVTKKHRDAEYLKHFVETILGQITDVESAKTFCQMIEEYKKESYQEESIVFKILDLKGRKKIAELEGRGTIDLDLELEKLEKLYAEDGETKIRNIISRITA